MWDERNKKYQASLFMVTQKEIADLLGISQPTVGAVLGKHSHKSRTGVGAELRQRILQKAEELGYRPNIAARAIAGGKSDTIGVIHFATSYSSTTEQITATIREVYDLGYHANAAFAVHNALSEENIEKFYRGLINQMIDLRVDGVLFSYMTGFIRAEEIARLHSRNIPIISVRGMPLKGIPYVGIDVASGGRELVEHLLSQGYRNLLMALPAERKNPLLHASPSYNEQRSAFFTDTIQRHGGQCVAVGNLGDQNCWTIKKSQKKPLGLTAEIDCTGSTSAMDNGRMFMEEFIRLDIPADVILFQNDEWMQGALLAANKHGVRVPEDIAMTGHDCDHFGRYGYTPFTTVQLPVEAIAKQATKLLDQAIKGNMTCSPNSRFLLPTSLVVGNTTRRIRD